MENDNSLKEKMNQLTEETIMKEKQPEQDFFCDDNDFLKKKNRKRPPVKPHNITRIKAWQFLTNISYYTVGEDDLFNRNFVFNVFVLLSKNLNPFSIERKIQEK